MLLNAIDIIEVASSSAENFFLFFLLWELIHILRMIASINRQLVPQVAWYLFFLFKSVLMIVCLSGILFLALELFFV